MTPPKDVSSSLPTASGRRAKFALRTLALLLAVTASCVFVGIITDRTASRYDVTATREHELSPRTQAVLKSIADAGPHEIVLVCPFSSLDKRTQQRTADVLDAFNAASPNLTTTIIDVAGADGAAKYEALLTRLAQRGKSELDAQAKIINAAADRTGPVVESLTKIAAGLVSAAEALSTGPDAGAVNADLLTRYFNDNGAAFRAAADAASKGADEARRLLGTQLGQSSLVPVDEAAAALRSQLSAVSPLLSRVKNDLEGVRDDTQNNVPAIAKDRAGPLAASVSAARDEVFRLIAELESLQRPSVLTAARALERSSAALVLGPQPGDAKAASGPRGVVAVDIDALLTPSIVGEVGGGAERVIDLRFRTEELLSGAIASLRTATLPIVVVVHGEDHPIGPGFAPMSAAVERLRVRGCEVLEWAAAIETEPPTARINTLNPAGTRPVVYLVVPTESGTAAGALRMGKVADALSRVLGEGKSALLCTLPSRLPTYGQKDPMTQMLADAWGVRVDTGRPILTAYPTPRGRVVSPDLVLTDAGVGMSGTERHPISDAIAGLRTWMTWASPIRVDAQAAQKAGVSVTPIVRVSPKAENDGQRWAESEWVSFFETPRDQQRLLTNPPSPDSARDDPGEAADGVQPGWIIAAALTRAAPGKSASQRVLIVGSSGWFFDPVVGVQSEVDGRRAAAFPGDLELLDAGVLWLAGQDDMIARSATAQSAPLIPPLTTAQGRSVWWLLVVVMPVGVLLVGAVLRVIRG